MTNNKNIVGYLPNVCGCNDCDCGAGFYVAQMPADKAVRVAEALNVIAPDMAEKHEMTNEDVAQSHLSEVAAGLEKQAGLTPAEAVEVANAVILHLWGAEFFAEEPECCQCGQNLPATQWGCYGCDLDAPHQ